MDVAGQNQQNFLKDLKKKLANGALKRIKWRLPLFGWTLYYTKNKMLNKKMILNKKRMIRKVSLWMISAYNSCRNDSNNQLTKSPTLRTHKTKNVGKKSFELVWTRTILGLAKKV